MSPFSRIIAPVLAVLAATVGQLPAAVTVANRSGSAWHLLPTGRSRKLRIQRDGQPAVDLLICNGAPLLTIPPHGTLKLELIEAAGADLDARFEVLDRHLQSQDARALVCRIQAGRTVLASAKAPGANNIFAIEQDQYPGDVPEPGPAVPGSATPPDRPHGAEDLGDETASDAASAPATPGSPASSAPARKRPLASSTSSSSSSSSSSYTAPADPPLKRHAGWDGTDPWPQPASPAASHGEHTLRIENMTASIQILKTMPSSLPLAAQIDGETAKVPLTGQPGTYYLQPWTSLTLSCEGGTQPFAFTFALTLTDSVQVQHHEVVDLRWHGFPDASVSRGFRQGLERVQADLSPSREGLPPVLQWDGGDTLMIVPF